MDCPACGAKLFKAQLPDETPVILENREEIAGEHRFIITSHVPLRDGQDMTTVERVHADYYDAAYIEHRWWCPAEVGYGGQPDDG